MKELFTAKDDPPVYAGIDDMCRVTNGKLLMMETREVAWMR